MRKLLSRFVATLSVSILIVVAITNLLIMIALHKIMKTVLVKEKAVSDCARHCKPKEKRTTESSFREAVLRLPPFSFVIIAQCANNVKDSSCGGLHRTDK